MQIRKLLMCCSLQLRSHCLANNSVNITVTIITTSLLCLFYSLSWNEVGDEGCAALSRGLQECRELQMLE